MFSRQVLERHLSSQHYTPYSDYAHRYLKANAPTEPPAAPEENGIKTEEQNGCIRVTIPLFGLNENGSEPKAEAVEGERGGFARRVNDDVWGWKLKSAVDYDEPALEGPGYRCPLPGCTFKTDLQVGELLF